MLDLADIACALVLVAHPDDIDFGVAGTVALLTDQGSTVTYCLATSGEAGGDDRTLPRADMGALREREQTLAAKHVGVTDLIFLGLPDGRLEAGLDLRRTFSRVIRTVKPNVVITMNPERFLDRIYASHPDHRAVGSAALDAVYPDARNPFAFPELLEEGLEPHAASEVWLLPHEEPNRLVDITTTIDRKIDALCCHESQISSRELAETILRGWARSNAETHGSDAEYAEAFRVVETG